MKQLAHVCLWTALSCVQLQSRSHHHQQQQRWRKLSVPAVSPSHQLQQLHQQGRQAEQQQQQGTGSSKLKQQSGSDLRQWKLLKHVLRSEQQSRQRRSGSVRQQQRRSYGG